MRIHDSGRPRKVGTGSPRVASRKKPGKHVKKPNIVSGTKHIPTSRVRQTGGTLQGIWQLRTREDYDAEGLRRIDPILGPEPLGILCFSTRHFAAQFMKRDRSASSESPAAPAGANNSAAVDGYDAYFGTYTRRAGTLTIRLDGSIAAANIGLVFTRAFRVDGNRLIIRLGTTASDGTPVTRTLTFDRLT